MPPKAGYGLYIKVLGDRLEQYANNQLQKRNLTFSQSKLLLFLGNQPQQTATMKELETMLHSAQSTVSGLVNRMEKKNLVVCQTASNDRRTKLVTLTAEGDQLRMACEQDMRESEAWLASALSEEENRLMLSMFRRMLERTCTDRQKQMILHREEAPKDGALPADENAAE